jgi:GTP-sensing pleiotropic transcriptional regulator CodY
VSYLGKANTGDYEGAMTFQEIADALGITKQLVWFYYVNALKKLRRKGLTLRRLHDLALELDRARSTKTL